MKGYVLISTDVGEEVNVVKMLRNVKSQGTAYISGADLTFGPYDVVATIEGSDLGELGRIVSSFIRSAPGVRETVTCVAIEVAGPAVPVPGLGTETPSIPVG